MEPIKFLVDQNTAPYYNNLQTLKRFIHHKEIINVKINMSILQKHKHSSRGEN